MSKDAKADQERSHRPPLWRIDRFELIFYNSRHRCWQYFAENPTAPIDTKGRNKPKESLHRREIRSLLSTIRDTFNVFTSKSPIFTLKRFQKSEDHFEINLVPPPSSTVPSGVWETYLKYLKHTADRERVPPEHLQNLKWWIAHPAEKQSFSHDEALTILSLLPIIEDWDTWGCFLRARNRTLNEKEESFPPASASDWSEPFSIVELVYSDHDSYSCPDNCSQKGLLSKHTEIEGLCQDLGDPAGQTHHVARDDFFDRKYCKLPAGEEKFLYQCYAHLIDPIFAAPVEQSDRRQFVIAYPISIGGRLHFLQIIVSAEVRSDVSVCSLWIDWQSIHRALWTTETRAFLQDELLRILTSAFQNEAYYHLSTPGSTVDGAQHLPLSVLRHIYHLLPVEAGVYETHFYSYHDYRWPETPSSTLQSSLYVGSDWRCAPGGTPGKSGDSLLEVPTPYGLTLFVPKDPKGHQVWQLTGQHRAVQVVEQQMQYLENLRSALHDERRRKEHDLQNCAMVNYGHLRGMGSTMQDSIRKAKGRLSDEVLNTAVIGPVAEVGDDFLPPSYRDEEKKVSFGRYLEQAYPEQSPEQILMIVQSLIRPSLLLLLSEYFETGLAKLKTHNISELTVLSGSRQDAMPETARLYETIYGELLSLEVKLSQAKLQSKLRTHGKRRKLRTMFAEFHRQLLNTIDKFGTDPELERMRSDLAIKRFSLGKGREVQFVRRDSGEVSYKPYEKHSRLFGVCPCCLLADFIQQYQQDIASGYQPDNGVFRHVCHLRHDIRYSSSYHRQDQLPVYMVEQLLYLPYVISDETEWKKSELLNCWTLTGQPIASLYTLSWTTSPEQTPIAKLLLVNPENEADRSLMSVTSRAAELAKHINPSMASSYLVVELQHWWMDDGRVVERLVESGRQHASGNN